MSEISAPPPEPKQDSCLVRGIRFIVRLTLVLILGIAIGIGIYYGVSWMVGEYVRITQEQEARITALEMQQTQMEQSLSAQMTDLQRRMDTLEIWGDSQKEALASLESQLSAQGEQIAAQNAALDAQTTAQEEMQTDLQALKTQVETLQSELSAMQTTLNDFGDQISALQSATGEYAAGMTEMSAFMAEGEAQLAAMRQQIAFLQAMELLTRARLNLVQGNLTLASGDITAARDLAAELQTELPDFQADYMDSILTALNGALDALPAAPLTAADQLETAWQLFFAGLPSEAPAAENGQAEATPEITETPAATPTP